MSENGVVTMPANSSLVPVSPALVVLGPFLVDRVRGAAPCRVWDHPGGNGLIFACVAARLGLPTALVAQLGDDAEGTALSEFLVRHGVLAVGLRTLADQPTKLSVIGVEPGGEWRTVTTWPLRYPYLGDPTAHADLLAGRPWVQVTGLCSLQRSCGHRLDGWIRTARLHALPLGFGLNKLHPGEARAVDAVVTPDDPVCCNREEFETWRGSRGSTTAALEEAMTAAPCGDLVVSLGREGVLARPRGGEPFHVRARPARVRSTIGAGDVLCAVTCCARLAGLPLRTAVEIAQRAAARSIGSDTWYAWLDEREGLLAELRVALKSGGG